MAESSKKTTIGGQALIEGLLMRGPTKSAIVVRKSDGTLDVKEDDVGSKAKSKLGRVPFIRGAFNFVGQMKYGVSALFHSASFFEDEDTAAEPGRFEKWLNRKFGDEKLEKIVMGTALVLGIAMPIVLFILLPTLLAGLLGDGLPNIVRNLIEGAIRIVIFMGFLWLTSLQKDMRRTYMYHGAEHKTIACYEAGLPLTVENVRPQKRQHPRCGTSFMFVVVFISILFFSIFSWSNPWIRMAIRLACLPLIVSIAYEINRFAGRHDNWLTRIIRAPGMFMQRFTTYEPDDSMIEVGIEALRRVIPEDEGADRW